MYNQQEISTKVAVLETRLNNMETNFKSYVDEQREQNTEFIRETKESQKQTSSDIQSLKKLAWMVGGALALLEGLSKAHEFFSVKHQ